MSPAKGNILSHDQSRRLRAIDDYHTFFEWHKFIEVNWVGAAEKKLQGDVLWYLL